MPASRQVKPPYKSLRRRVLAALSAVEKPLYVHGIRSTRKLSLPDFLGIGTQKAGTTWLWENLRVHPELFLPDKKELHYFDWNFYRPLTYYARYFEPAGGKVKGEITPNYCALPPERVAFIARIMPDAKLVLFLRNPIERAWSRAVMVLVRKRGRAFDDITEEEWIAQLTSKRSIARGNYPRMLHEWDQHYRDEQLYVAFFDQIVRQPRELLAEVFEHLGVSTDVNWDDFPYNQVIHQGEKAAMPEKIRRLLEDMYRKDIEVLHQRFGQRVAHWRM